MGVLAFGAAANASLIIEFDGSGGGMFETIDGDVIGSGINIDTIFVTSTTNDVTTTQEYQVDSGILAFNTGTGEAGEITITGIVDSLNIGDVLLAETVVLFSGAIGGNESLVDGFSVFLGTGGGNVDLGLLNALGESQGAFTLYAFTLGIDGVGTITTDITASQLEGGLTPEVPIPAAAWLFGSGLLGLMGVARRKA